MARLSLHRLFLLFLRVGSFTFGGGDPIMAVLQSELVETERRLSAEKYGLVYGLARITPGTNVLAFCAGAAWQIAGWAGAVLAVLAVSFPPAIIVLLLTAGYESWKTNPAAMAAIAGSLAAAVGMMGASAWQLLQPHLTAARWFRGIAVFGASLLLSLWLSMSPIQVLGLAAVTGLIWRAPEQR